MKISKEIPEGGSYSEKQIKSSFPLISWSHRNRFKLARDLVVPFSGKKLLDYGCGDGTFLALVSDLFSLATGVDSDLQQVSSCQKRFEKYSNLKFIPLNEISKTAHSFDVIVCMEVLEHCLDEKVDHVLSELRNLVSQEGKVIVSVPIEIGPSLLIKELFRALAGLFRWGDYQYKEKYSCLEFLKMVFAGPGSSIDRPILRSDFAKDKPNFYHGHKGFNWRALEKKIEKYFVIEKKKFSPLYILPSFFNSQVWFICTVKSNIL